MDTTKQTWGHGLPDQVPAAPRLPAGDPSWARSVRADLTGGVVAALLAIPVSIGYGILALAPLGPDRDGRRFPVPHEQVRDTARIRM